MVLLGSFTDPHPTAGYAVVCAVITLVAVFSFGETSKRDLAADDVITTSSTRPEAHG